MSRQRNKTLRNCPSCNRAELRPERTAKVDGKEVCDDCYIESIRKKVLGRILSARDDDESVSRLDSIIQNAEDVKAMIIKANKPSK